MYRAESQNVEYLTLLLGSGFMYPGFPVQSLGIPRTMLAYPNQDPDYCHMIPSFDHGNCSAAF